MLETFDQLVTIDGRPSFCLRHIEDRLREILMQSQLFAAVVVAVGGGANVGVIAETMQLGPGDADLLRGVAGSFADIG
jgi:hypothetical protein